MFMKKIFISAISTTALLGATAAFAVTSIPFGWYLEAGAGPSHQSKKNYPGASNSNGAGASGSIGYKFMPYMGLDFGYSKFADTSIKVNNGTKAATDQHYGFHFAIKGILPMADYGVEAFGKIGVNRLSSKLTINDPAAAASANITKNNAKSSGGLYLGAGMQYYFMPELAVVGEWQRYQGNSSVGSMDIFTIGFSFLFD